MKPILPAVAAASLAAPALVQEARGLDAHVHGIAKAGIAVGHGAVEISLRSPGMDIIGFECAASLAEEEGAVAAAAGCRLTEVRARLHSGGRDDGDENGHGEGHGGEQDLAGHDHGDADGGQHSESHARYAFAREGANAPTAISFPFLERFGNAQEIAVQYVTGTGAGSAEVARAAPELTFE